LLDHRSVGEYVVHILVAVVAGLAVTQFSLFVTSVYLHRGLTHRALNVDGRAELFFRVAIWVTTGMRPRQWVAVHRRHHATTDTIDDPHSPAVLGFWRVQLTNAGLYRKVARDRMTVQRYARDIPGDRLDRLFFDHAFLGLGIGISILCLTFGWKTGLPAAAIHAVSYLMLAGAVNAVGHTVGGRPHENSGTNSNALALISAGEGLHNNHHAAPTSARFSFAAGQIDPGWWFVRVLVRCRLATIRHHEVKLKHAA
jgi:stearoyl-CoA desaturase (delta-9 desaturase)